MTLVIFLGPLFQQWQQVLLSELLVIWGPWLLVRNLAC